MFLSIENGKIVIKLHPFIRFKFIYFNFFLYIIKTYAYQNETVFSCLLEPLVLKLPTLHDVRLQRKMGIMDRVITQV